MVEGVHFDLLDLVSNCHEAGKDPRISEDLSTLDTTGSSLKSCGKGMEHSYISFVSYTGKMGKPPNIKEWLMQVMKCFSQFSWAVQFFVTLVSFVICLNLTSLPMQKCTRDQDDKMLIKYHFLLEVLASIELRCIVLQC